MYNAAPFLDKCINSALSQRQTGEVLLIDDTSTDDSLSKCREWEAKDSRVKVLINDGGVKGAGPARNIGLRNAVNEFISFLDADDYFLEGRFDEDEQLYKSRNDVVSIASSVIINTYNLEDFKYLNRSFEHNKICGGSQDYSWVSISNLLYGSSIKITGLSLRKNVALSLQGFNENLKQCEDTDFLVRLILNYSLFTPIVGNPVCVRNVHKSNTIANILESIYYRKIIYKKFMKLAIFTLKDFNLFMDLLKSYFEIDLISLIGEKDLKYKKMYKVLLSPIIIFKLIFITKSMNEVI